MALALAFAIAAMQILKSASSSGRSNPFIVFLLGANWDYLLPTLIGSLLIVLVELLYNNISKIEAILSTGNNYNFSVFK